MLEWGFQPRPFGSRPCLPDLSAQQDSGDILKVKLADLDGFDVKYKRKDKNQGTLLEPLRTLV